MSREPRSAAGRSNCLHAALAALAALVLLALAAPAAAQADADFDGAWEGTFSDVSGPGLVTSANPFPLIRIVIEDERVRVYLFEDGRMTEVKSGTFRIRREGANAVISSIEIDPGRPPGEGWVETWVFAATFGDEDTLITTFVRVVNNNDIPPSRAGARFSMVRTGELRRMRRDDV